MSKQVVFQIGSGDFENGFPVKLQIRENGRLCVSEVNGKLSPAPEIVQLLNDWREEHISWGKSCRWWRGITVPNQINTNYSSGDSEDGDREDNTSKIAPKFERALNEWLDHYSIQDIRDELLHTVDTNDSVSFIVETENPELQKIPWELWRLLRRRYRYAEVALSNIRVPQKGSLSLPVKILVILGSDERIDIETDWNIIQNNLPKAQLVLLRKPSARELREKLRTQPWDIVFFAGHSATEKVGNDAIIWINDQEYLSPRQLIIALERAVENGLKLAIFNSCDGLGLARQLANLQIPHIIVMRQPIHDNVAQRFLDDLLTCFARGASLPQAMREARDNLRLIEYGSPNASWLPVLFQNPEETPLFYPQAARSPQLLPKLTQLLPKRAKYTKQKIMLLGILPVVVLLIAAAYSIYNSLSHRTGESASKISLNQEVLPKNSSPEKEANVTVIAQDSTSYQAAESAPGISLGEEALFKNSSPEKKAGVEAFAKQIYTGNKGAIAFFKAALKRNPKDVEAKIYLNNARAAIQKGEPLKIAVSVPIGSNQSVAEEILQGFAQLQEKIKDNEGINGKLLQVVIANDDNKEERAKEVAHNFVKDTKILAVVGHNASDASLAAKDIYEQGKLVAISPTSFDDDLTGNSYIFRMVPQLTQFATQISESIHKKVSQPKIGLCLDPKSPDNEAYASRFKEIYLAKPQQLINLKCDLSNQNFKPSSVVAEIKKHRVNALLMSPHIDRIAKATEIFKAVRDKKLQIKLFGSPSLNTNKTIETGGKAVEGLILAVPWYRNITGKQEINQKETTWRSPMAYDAAFAITTALEKLPQPNRQELNSLLRNSTFEVDGVTGKFKFDPSTGAREFLTPNGALFQIKNGKFVRIE